MQVQCSRNTRNAAFLGRKLHRLYARFGIAETVGNFTHKATAQNGLKTLKIAFLFFYSRSQAKMGRAVMLLFFLLRFCIAERLIMFPCLWIIDQNHVLHLVWGSRILSLNFFFCCRPSLSSRTSALETLSCDYIFYLIFPVD